MTASGIHRTVFMVERSFSVVVLASYVVKSLFAIHQLITIGSVIQPQKL